MIKKQRRQARKQRNNGSAGVGLRDLFGNPTAVTTVLTEKGSFVSSNTLTTNSVATFSVNPGLVGRLSAISQVFELYRFRNLKVEFLHGNASGPGCTVFGFQTSVPGSPPTTLAQVSELPDVAVCWQLQTTPAMLTIGPREFSQFEYKWLPTDNTLGPHGYLYLVQGAAATNPVYFRIQYTVEFAQPVSSGHMALPREVKSDVPPPASWEELADDDESKSTVSESVARPPKSTPTSTQVSGPLSRQAAALRFFGRVG